MPNATDVIQNTDNDAKLQKLNTKDYCFSLKR